MFIVREYESSLTLMPPNFPGPSESHDRRLELYGPSHDWVKDSNIFPSDPSQITLIDIYQPYINSSPPELARSFTGPWSSVVLVDLGPMLHSPENWWKGFEITRALEASYDERQLPLLRR